MNKIETLQELRLHLRKGITQGYEDTMSNYVSGNNILTGWADLRVVIVGSLAKGVRCCARSNKENDETEIVLIRKPPIDYKMRLTAPIGLTQKNWNKVIPKCAAWLEKHGLYIDRKVITDKTPVFQNMA